MPGYELIGEEEKKEINEIFEKGAILYRNEGYKVKEFETAFCKEIGAKYSLGVTSGTAALRVALAALNIGEGDEVITQSFTFVATVEAIVESRATPICIDIDDTLNMHPKSLEKAITSKTKAVIAVHMLGVPADLENIQKICNKYNIFLIEDTAWGCGGKLNGKSLGTWGDFGAFSFDYAKTMTTGEGGMLVSNNSKIFNKAKAWHDHGHENNPLLPRWEDSRSSSGFNYRMMELQGAIGLAQLKKLKNIIHLQRKNQEILWNSIKDIGGIEKRKTPQGSYETADALIFLVKDKTVALNCREELLKEDIGTKILPEAYTWHFAGTWDHIKDLVKSAEGNLDQSLIKSKKFLSRAVSLPISTRLNEEIPLKLRAAIKKAVS